MLDMAAAGERRSGAGWLAAEGSPLRADSMMERTVNNWEITSCKTNNCLFQPFDSRFAKYCLTARYATRSCRILVAWKAAADVAAEADNDLSKNSLSSWETSL